MSAAGYAIGLTALVTLATVCSAVEITRFNVSSYHVLDNEQNAAPLILDCDYNVDPNERGFVLKWLLNGSRIFQWIPNQWPSYGSSFMKNFINVNHTASYDTTKRHRALAIMRPMKNMSGNYECSVSTYKSNDIKSAHLQMIVPHSEFVLQTKLNEPKTEWAIECFAKNTYPEPELLITLGDRKFFFPKRSKRDDVTGLYSTTIIGLIKSSDVDNEADIDCVLKIPGTEYVRSARNGANDSNNNGFMISCIGRRLTLIGHFILVYVLLQSTHSIWWT